MKRGQKFIVDINCPRMSDIRRPSISWLANRGGREREKTRVLVQGLYRSLEWKAKPEARFNQAIEKRAGARKIDGWGRHNNERAARSNRPFYFSLTNDPSSSLCSSRFRVRNYRPVASAQLPRASRSFQSRVDGCDDHCRSLSLLSARIDPRSHGLRTFEAGIIQQRRGVDEVLKEQGNFVEKILSRLNWALTR